MAKILFYQNGAREQEGLMAISGYLKQKGHRTDVLIEGAESLYKKMGAYKPDIIGMQVLTKDHSWAIERALEIKQISPNTITLLGGPHPTFYHKIALEGGIDGICIGEGEKPTLSIMDHLDRGTDWKDTESIWYQKDGQLIKNPLAKGLEEDIPTPDRDLYKEVPGIRDTSDLQIMCSRGCPYKCNFCINYGLTELFGKRSLRLKKPQSIIEEISSVRNTKGIDTIHFQDDIFGLNKKWFEEFSREYISKVNLPFYALLRCELIDGDLVDRLKEMRCYEVGIGIESGSERVRNEILGKRLKTSTILEATTILKRKKLPFHTFNMFGLPGEDLSDAYKTLDLNIEISPDVAYTQIFHPYPGTKFFDEGVELHIVGADFDLFSTNHPYSHDTQKIQRLQKLAMLVVKFPSLRPLVPGLINLPVDDRVFDNIAKETWEKIYHQKLKNKE